MNTDLLTFRVNVCEQALQAKGRSKPIAALCQGQPGVQ
jgi:hypothetical protein